jgi:hypothetical protein
MHFRSKAQVARFFDGLEVVPPYAGAAPAVTYGGLWGAEDVRLADSDGSRWLYCAVARKPLPSGPRPADDLAFTATFSKLTGRMSSSRHRRS